MTEAAEGRLALFTHIHEIVFYGKGGYDWNTVYNMPVWLRKFTHTRILEAYEQEAKAAKKQTGGKSNKTTLMDSDGNVNKDAAVAFNPGKVKYN